MKKIKITIRLTLLFVTILTNVSLFCQEESGSIQLQQFSTGKDKIIFTVLDYETNEPLIGATIYSFNVKKILATTDIDGIAITEKKLKGNLEISYIAYYPFCFSLLENSIDSVVVWLKPEPIHYGYPVIDTTKKVDLSAYDGEYDAQLDLEEFKVKLLTTVEPSEEQILFAKNHNFEFKVYEGNEYYREAYNKVVLDFLNKKYERNIEEELREICWRNNQP